MAKHRISPFLAVVCLVGTASLRAQSGPASDANSGASASVVPRLIKFSGEVNPQISQINQIKQSEDGKSQSPTVVGLSFSLYEPQEGGSVLWSESQKVRVDEQGRYTVLLGATQPDGLPLDLFTSGKALWLGVQPQLPGATEQPRVLLVAVPYALKGSDSDTLGGLPASAFLAATASPLGVASSQSGSAGFVNGQRTTDNGQRTSAPQPGATCGGITSDGTATANSIAMFTTNCNLEASAITQTSGNIGISGASPANTKFQITDTPAADSGIHYTNHELLNSSVTKNGTNKGLTYVMDLTNTTIPAGVTDCGYRVGVEGAGYANTTGFAGTLGAQYGVWGRAGIVGATSGAAVRNAYAGYFDILNSMAGTTITNAYGVYIANTGTTGTITNRYDLYAASANGKSYFAGNVGIGTTSPAAALDVHGTGNFTGNVTFATTQTFPGTLMGVATGGGLVTTGSTVGLLKTCSSGQSLSWNGSAWGCASLVAGGGYATLGANSFSATQTISSGDVSLTSGNFDLPQTTGYSAGMITMAGAPFIHACCSPGQGNTFVGGSAGYVGVTGSSNTGIGTVALNYITAGSNNTATGRWALTANTTGNANTADGTSALASNNGSWNTATGSQALNANSTGSNNTGTGNRALQMNDAGSNNAAVGACALLNTTRSGNSQACAAPAPGSADANTAMGTLAGKTNATGNSNTFVGFGADAASGGLTNATAIGANAVVSASNALVLGGTGANAVNVGIGTSAPAYTLDVAGTGHFTGAVTFAGGETITGNISTSNQLISTVANGTPPLQVASTTEVANLNASLLGGLPSSAFALLGAANTFTTGQTVGSGDLSVSNGNIDLPPTTSTSVGVVTMGGNFFMHACCPSSSQSAFVGTGAGNFSANASTTNSGLGQNTGVGYGALASLSTGFQNTATGWGALSSNDVGASNTAIGMAALNSNHAGSNNTASGTAALFANDQGSYNVGVGSCALLNTSRSGPQFKPCGASISGSNTANYNTAVGANAGQTNTTGVSNTFVGVQADAASGGLFDATAIGANAQVTQSNTMVLGSIKGVKGAGTSVNVGIGTTTPVSSLHVLTAGTTASGDVSSGDGIGGECGGAKCVGVDGISTGAGGYGVYAEAPNGIALVAGTGLVQLVGKFWGNVDVTGCLTAGGTNLGGGCSSDARLKTNIRPLAPSLEKLAELQPVSFNWRADNPAGYRFDSNHAATGLIAQQVEEVFPEMVSTDKNGYKRLDNGPLPFMLLQGVKELKARNDSLSSQVQQQQGQILVQQAGIEKQRAQIKAQKASLEAQQAQIAQLVSQVAVIEASLKANHRTGAAVRVAKIRVVPKSSRTNAVPNLAARSGK